MVLWTTFFSLQFQANFLVGEKNLPGLRFLAGSGSGFNEYGSETLFKSFKSFDFITENLQGKQKNQQDTTNLAFVLTTYMVMF